MQTKRRGHPLLTAHFLFPTIMFLVVLALWLYTWSWPVRPRELPLLVEAIVIIMLAVEIFRAVQKYRKDPNSLVNAPVLLEDDEGDIEEAAEDWGQNAVVVFAAIAACIGLAWVVGLVLATGLLGVVLAWLYGERLWWKLLLIGLVSAAVLQVLFGMLLMIPLSF